MVTSSSIGLCNVYLLVREHRAALEWSHVAAEQGSAGPVVLTEDGTVDVMEAVPGHQSVSTGGAAETLQGSTERDSGQRRHKQRPGVLEGRKEDFPDPGVLEGRKTFQTRSDLLSRNELKLLWSNLENIMCDLGVCCEGLYNCTQVCLNNYQAIGLLVLANA